MINNKTKITSAAKWCAISFVCVATASCSTTTQPKQADAPKKRSKEYFAESVYGVKASPRVVENGEVPKGGGRFLVGNSYTIKGRRYQPREEAGYDRSGLASWYGSAFHGRKTANGEIYDQNHLSAAHPTMPLPSYARVTNRENGASVMVRVNDRGPFHAGRLIDVSSKTAELLDMKRTGTANVRVQYVGRAPLEGDDTQYLMASYSPKGGAAPENRGLVGSMLASVGLGGANSGSASAPSPVQQPQMVAMADNAYAVPVPQQRSNVISAENVQIHSAQMALTSQPQTLGQQALNASFGAPAMLSDYPILPEYGPNIMMRPDGQYLSAQSGSYVAAYNAETTSVSQANAAFDAILVGGDGLTEDAILAFAKRRGNISQ